MAFYLQRATYLGARLGALALGTWVCFASPKPAAACGGCFHGVVDTSTSFVTDHRMALSISQTQTVLWDQVKYTGAPAEFAWVLPVRDGARVELAHDEWLSALDLATQVQVASPVTPCGGGFSGSGSGGGCGAVGSDNDFATSAGSSSGGNFMGNGDVTVVSQSVVGPYAAVTIRSTKALAINDWLVGNGFEIPENIAPTLAAYTREKFDFLALKLRPGVDVGRMRPVRVITPGANPMLPLRMVAAGIGAKVGLELYVIAEGRYRPKNFPVVEIDPKNVAWDGAANRSNYTQLVQQAFTSGNQNAWLVEASVQELAQTSSSSTGAGGFFGSGGRQSTGSLYEASCATKGYVTIPCDEATSTLMVTENGSADAGARDAGDGGDASTVDAGDSGTGTTPQQPSHCMKSVFACDTYDDLTTATKGSRVADLWVTRMRASLSPEACAAADLVLEPEPLQVQKSPNVIAASFTDPKFQPCPASNGSSSSNDNVLCGCNAPARAPWRGAIGFAGVAILLHGFMRRQRTKK